MIYILWGEDQFSLEEKLQEIKSQLGDLSLMATNTTVLDGQKLSLNELKMVGEAMPFLAPRRLVIVKGLLERFESREKSTRSKKSAASESKQDASQNLAKCIQGFPESTILVLMDILEMKKTALQNNALFKALEDSAEVKAFPLLKDTRLKQWIQERVTRQGGSISQQATKIMMETIGGDLYTMSNEISKLVAFAMGRQIEEKDVRLVVSASQEADIFAMVDAIMDHKVGVAERILQKLFQEGVVAPQILAMIARQIQMLVQVKELRGLKRPVSEIQTRLGIFSSFVWEKISGRSDKYTPERLKEIYQNLVDTDLAIKTGKLEGDLALNLLVADLCEKK